MTALREPDGVATGPNGDAPLASTGHRDQVYWDGQSWTHESAASAQARLVGDHAVVAERLQQMLATAEDVQVVAIATNAAQALEEVLRHEPHVIAMDYRLRDAGTVDTPAERQVCRPATKILVVIGSEEPEVLDTAIHGDVVAGLDDASALERLLVVVENAAQANTDSPAAGRRGPTPVDGRGRDPVAELTRRQAEILGIMANGLSDQAIADHLTLSLHTVRTHVQTILRKLGAHSKLEAVAVATRRRLLSRPEGIGQPGAESFSRPAGSRKPPPAIGSPLHHPLR